MEELRGEVAKLVKLTTEAALAVEVAAAAATVEETMESVGRVFRRVKKLQKALK